MRPAEQSADRICMQCVWCHIGHMLDRHATTSLVCNLQLQRYKRHQLNAVLQGLPTTNKRAPSGSNDLYRSFSRSRTKRSPCLTRYLVDLPYMYVTRARCFQMFQNITPDSVTVILSRLYTTVASYEDGCKTLKKSQPRCAYTY